MRSLFKLVILPIFLFCCPLNVCPGFLEKSLEENNTQTLADDGLRQGRPSSVVVETVPTYSWEFRSQNEKDIKFTSGGLYQATIFETKKSQIICDLKMGVYAHDENTEVEFNITKGNAKIFTVGSKRVKDFIFMDITTERKLNREEDEYFLLTIVAQHPKTKEVLDTTEVNVTVLDLNDNLPKFSRLFQHVTIDEDIPLHTSVAQVVANDEDMGPNGLLYFSFISKSPFFAIDPISGVVTVTRSLASKRRRSYGLLVTARDRTLPTSKAQSAKAKHNITVTVRPVNRFSPEIKVKSQLEKITEGNSDIHFAIIQVSDQDNANSGEINKVRITSGNENEHFKIRRSQNASNEYWIDVVKPLDREKTPNGYKLVITAFDKGSPPRSGTVSLRVLIEDANDMKPAFNQSLYEATISELAPLHTSVVRVFVEDGDLGNNAKVYYTLRGGDSKDFHIDRDTGLITTTGHHDYETKPVLEFDVWCLQSDSSKQMASAKISINIEDANDNDPEFENPSYSLEFFEDLRPGTKLPLTVKANDPDSEKNGKIHYSIINRESVPFAIDSETGDIILLTSLDRDAGVPEYITLKIRASDFGEPFRRESETYVHLHIKATNDNQPVFEYFRCTIKISEDAPTGTILTSLTAVDIDVGESEGLFYGIDPVGNTDKTFSINPSTGQLTTAKSLKGGEKEFSLYVTVNDSILKSKHPVTLKIMVVSPQTATEFLNYVETRCSVFPHYHKALEHVKKQRNFKPSYPSSAKVPAKPANTNYPEFNAHKSVIEVSEDIAVKSTIMKFSATDYDQGYNGMILYSIVSGNIGSAFNIGMYSGGLYVAASLDRETTRKFALNISASDCGSPGKTAYTVIYINVIDVNDNAPVFEQEIYEETIPENITRGQTVVVVNATDIDGGENGRIDFKLLNDFGGKFRINSKTGRLSVARVLDYEDRAKYIIEVQAFDNSPTSQRMASATVIVKLVDINDNAPAIVPRVFNVSIPEDLPPESVVAAISAEDLDTSSGGELEFSFVGSPKRFKIDSGSGVIRLRRHVDYEQEDVYNLKVKISDKGTPRLTSFADVNVNILDVNENNIAPIFTGLNLLKASVFENNPVGTSVLKVKAFDSDSWYVSYFIIDGTGVDKFEIGQENGIIRTTQVLNREDGDHYWLHIQAKDREMSPLHTNIPLLITVLSVSDDPPYFNPAIYFPFVIENAAPGESVVTVKAHNPSSDGSNLLYSIKSGNEAGRFAIDKTSGLITTTTALDREEQDKYELKVEVSNGDNPPKSAHITFPVTVADANDNDPYFLKSTDEPSYDVKVKKQDDPSTFVEILRVAAADKDISSNADLTYGLLYPPEISPGQLKIDPKTGVISAKLSCQDDNYLEFSVKVIDGGVPPRSASVPVVMEYCMEKNPPSSEPPYFTQKTYKKSFKEDVEVGSVVEFFSASYLNPDFLTYSIISGNIGNKFLINRGTGEVIIAGKLDYEEASSYTLTIQVSDNHNTNTTTLEIEVDDVNDNSPLPLMTEYQVHIPEDAKIGSLLTRVEATDRDAGARGSVEYAIVGSVKQKSLSLFAIQSLTGDVETTQLLDYEDLREHTLVIEATDQVTPKRQSLFTIVIKVDDMNDHKPVFVQSEFKAEVNVDSSISTPIIKVFATDDDDGTNALLKFSIKGGNTNNAFYIDQNSGVIQVAAKLSSAIDEYSLQVQVSDSGIPAETAEVEVKILVRGIKQPAEFERPLYQASIKENLRPGHPIINVVFNGSLSSYEFVPQDNACWKDFDINRKSGLVTNKKPFDAEELTECKLLIRGESSDGTGQTQLIVKIIDENDHAPTFSQVLYLGHIKEGLPEDSPVISGDGNALVIQASDADVSGSDLMYEVVGCSAFRIDSQTGELLAAEMLDFETVSSYRFMIKVSDDGAPSLSAFADVVVSVHDVNDLPPIFSSSVFEAVVFLPTYSGSVITTVTAADGDSHSLTNLTYSITMPSVIYIFDISPRQGLITVKNSSLLHQAVYRVQVSVSDGNFSNQATVVIDCKPLPVSDLQFSQMEYNTSVAEGVSTATDIAQVQTVGYSVGDTITYSIVVPSNFFAISKSTGIVSTLPGKTFDRETTDRYEVVVQARDDRKPMPRVAQSLLYVIVDDVNDNAPIYTEDVYFFVIQVSADVGEFVGHVQANDKDIGSNGAIKYLLKGGGESRFEIDHATGNIEVSRLLDDVKVPTVFTLEIEAQDKGLVRLSAKTTVKIKVVDKETPIFDHLSYSRVVREDVKVGEEVTRVQARSPGGAGILYTVLAGDPYNQFGIDLKTGVLTVESFLDYEARTSYQLLVRATDELTTSYGEITVLVTVTDVNDIAPLFNQSLYLATIPEDTPIGTSVVSFTAFDGDSGVNRQLTYRLETFNAHNNSKISEFFLINRVRRQIVVAKKLDYEQNIIHELKLIVTDGGTPPLTGEARVRIVIEDTNDNPPMFEQNSYATSISGSAGPGFFVTRVVASDPDDDDVGKLRYSIISGYRKEYFQIDSTSGVLTISKHVGIERGKVYNLGVEVTDGKSTAETSVRVVIGDINDHSPIFDQEVYPVEFNENYPSGTFVTMVTATDLDSGDYAQVRYSIDDIDAAEKFSIDAETGMIYSKLSFDRENASQAFSSIPVRATDGGGRFGFCTVEVKVLDENDNQPKFELPLYEVTIHSTAPVGTSILMTSANDADTGSNGALSYVILGHQTPPVFEIEKDSGFIKISRRPETKTYMFHVLVKDGGFPYLRNMVKVSVNVLRKNAKILQFEKSEYRILVPEDLNTNRVITTVRTLLPGSTSPRVGFQIIAGNSPSSQGEQFSIDASGQIKLKRRLDYETLKRYVLVIAANSTEISQVARAVVVVSVTDVNDNKPHFVANPYRVSIPENMMVKSKVLRVFAEDLDDAKNGEILYDFETKSNLFAIDQHTGWITITAPIDREVANSLLLRVRANDEGGVTQLSGYTTVEVNVLDVNDSPPQFTEDIFIFSVREDALIGQEVGTLTSFDNDTNSDVYFFIMSGDPQTKFGIEQKTGKVFVHSPLDRESVLSYTLNVSCSDGLFTSFTTLIIRVLDANDNLPVCTQSISIVHLSEDVKRGTEVMIVEASDLDADDNGKLRYSVFGQGMGFFGVENGTGRLVTVALLDREVQDMYNFMVSAEDRGGQACFSNVTVLLEDVNDNRPVFSQSEYRRAVYEDARINKVLLQVKADDSDLGKNRKISYSLLDTAGDTFRIDSKTGVITLTSGLNREKQAEYTLTVQADDAGVPPQSETCTVVIQVLNINDVPPEFAESSYKANVSEDATKGKKITKMNAFSREAGHEEFSYEILKGPDSDMFKIDKKTGEVTLEGSLDFETRKSYSLTIQASDAGPPVLSTTCSLSVIVTDANDHIPTFGQDIYTARVDENSAVDLFVLQVFATDLDSGSNRDIRYSIVKGNGADKFKIDEITGAINIKAHVDHESLSQYTLTVRAQDRGKPPLSAETQVEVNINDLNDNPPEFTNTNFTVSVSELAAIGTTVIFLRPHDRDGPGNGGPFTFMRIEGDETKFKLERNGLITKAGPLDHRDKEHKLRFRVFDSGEPPRYADKTLTIIVVEGVSHPPVVEPLTVYLKLYSSQFNGGVIGSVKGTDTDGDPLKYSIVAPRSGNPFTITNSGVISATSNVPSRIYNLNISVSDGKYVTYAPVKIVVSDITEDILRHSLTLRLLDLSPGTFVERNLAKCKDYLGFLLNVPAENVHIWSLQSSDANLDVVFAVTKRVKGFYASQHIAHKLNSSRGDFQRAVEVQVGYIGVSQCPLMHCPENYSCRTVYKPQNKQIRIMSERTTYTSFEHSRSHACMCDRDKGCASGKCASNPCPVGYECADFPLGFQCKCVDSSKCQPDEPGCEDQSCKTGNTAISFSGDSYIRFKLKQSFDEQSRSISLAFKTTEPRGTLVWAAGQYDYSILEILNGCLQLRFDFGSGAGVVNLDWARIDDDKWHHVAVMRQGNHATLILDKGRHRAWNKSPGKMRILNLDDNAIYFGAKVVKSKTRREINNQGQLVEDGFKGCLQNLKLNHQDQDLPMSGSNSYVAAEPFNAVPGCQLSGKCRINTCPRDSICIETLTSKKCECLRGHSGPECRAFVGCDASPCQNGGTCLPHPTDRYQCRCKNGYSGTQCHIFTGHCASTPCRNGGSCIPNVNSGFICDCPAGVQGRTCEQDTRPCSSNPCVNNANCTNYGESYKCHCRPGFSGESCDKGYRCSEHSPCQNGGTCVENQEDGVAVCRCPQGYTGVDCFEDVDECASSPCKNGGVCENQQGGFKCNCSTSTHGGDLCEQVLANVEARRGWPLGQTEIIGIAVVLAVILLIVFLVVIFLRRRAKRRREKREQTGTVSTSVLKVSPPVVGSEVTSPEPPTPPPREVHGYNVDDLGMPPGYDAEDSWRRREKVRKDFGTMKTLTSLSDNNLPGYQWDYTDIPADLVPRTPLSKEHSGSYSGSPDCTKFAPEVPQRPSSFRSSQGSIDVPEIPKRPRNYKVSESEDGYTDVPHVPKKPMEYTNPRGKSASRYSMDSRFSEFSDGTDLDPDIFKGRFPRPPREPYPESLDQLPVGSYAPTLTARGSELGSVTDGMYSEDDLEQVYLGNRMEVCDDSPENSYLHSENCSEDEDDDYHRDRFARAATPDPEFHKELQREIKEMMSELEELKLESEI